MRRSSLIIVPRDPMGEMARLGSGKASTEIVLPGSMGGLTLERTLNDYRREHMVANGATHEMIRRFGYVAKQLRRVIGPDRDINTFDRADGRTYAEARIAEGVKPSTVGRELTFLRAVCNHQRREGRTKHEFKLWMPPRGEPRVRVLTHEEERALMLLPKVMRIQMFLLLAFNTGARSRAIEELTWTRVDTSARTIDYRVPGVKYKNKRRVVAPMNNTLLKRLTAARERAVDEYVIGRGARGRVSTTYHPIKQCYRAIGIDELGVCRHVARHTFATRLLVQRVPISEVAKLLGDTVEMVEKVYAHYIPSDLLPAVNMLGAVNRLQVDPPDKE